MDSKPDSFSPIRNRRTKNLEDSKLFEMSLHTESLGHGDNESLPGPYSPAGHFKGSFTGNRNSKNNEIFSAEKSVTKSTQGIQEIDQPQIIIISISAPQICKRPALCWPLKILSSIWPSSSRYYGLPLPPPIESEIWNSECCWISRLSPYSNL